MNTDYTNVATEQPSSAQATDEWEPVPAVPAAPAAPAAPATPVAPTAPVAPSSWSSPLKSATPPFQIFRNAAGQRVDPPLPRSFKEDMTALKAQAVCRRFYVLGRCEARERGDPCSYGHSQLLSAKEIETLRFMVRSDRVCSKGLARDDPWCIDGHRCFQGDRCWRADFAGRGIWRSKFSLDMHRVDTNIVSVVEPPNSLKRRRSEF